MNQLTTSKHVLASHGWLLSLNPNPHTHTTGLPFCRAYAPDAVCADIFEFPNKACELPFVWGTPLEAEMVCKLQGKRLCQDKEWNLACSADPLGVKSWPYAYGEALDMTACHTNVSKRKSTGRPLTKP